MVAFGIRILRVAPGDLDQEPWNILEDAVVGDQWEP
jgi:hypothetical protein